ncbi:hypothetical protein J1N35_038465 [Gossypium stocksii]|uniref:Uncharacterized protein n=1 Tax=Gossypium stocksii TaxID=47602 RepID=A0A9D3UM21_9ROSI|nr:hypothetical protein J1N35_038465 [Gossypium stocksii]
METTAVKMGQFAYGHLRDWEVMQQLFGRLWPTATMGLEEEQQWCRQATGWVKCNVNVAVNKGGTVRNV